MHDADIELLASQIAYKELERRQTKELNEKTDAIVKKNEAMEQVLETNIIPLLSFL